MLPDKKRGILVVFAAPSGAGKTTIIHEVMEQDKNLTFSISSTTRPVRAGEVDGVDYDFLSDAAFDEAIEDGDFIEYELVHLYRYGTRKSRVEPLLEEGRDIVFDLDVLGALNIKKLYPEALLIFIDVKSKDVLKERLALRGREGKEEILKRLERYDMEKENARSFDYIVINDVLGNAVCDVQERIEAWKKDE